MARHPGTPVGDLFPPGVAIFGAGGGQGQQALPPARSHSKPLRVPQWASQSKPASQGLAALCCWKVYWTEIIKTNKFVKFTLFRTRS